ncbi:AAA family ATPase [Dyella lutea]|uniref:AAA family ATPase n=1 Tax=Dyella lutea TaxID=2950441 RepID=A0ABT1FHM5_9GAMM|nr:AAA family ATPase [Dyella lutea]MCP1375928.1 AAA family ATPase [Dyella lutea]
MTRRNRNDQERAEVLLASANELPPQPIDWLWEGWLATKCLQLIAGAPGAGKTTLAMTMAAAVSRGGQMPDGSHVEAGCVVIWSGEDDYRTTLVPRLLAAGADMTRITFVMGVRRGDEKLSFDPARDLPELHAAIRLLPDVRLIIIDPVVSAVAKDSNQNSDVRRGLQPLVDMAAALGAAVLGITHFSKGTQGREPLERLTGSLAFGAVPRLVMVAVRQSPSGDRLERRILVRAKSNNGPDGDGFEFHLRNGELPDHPNIQASWVEWGPPLKGTARALLAEAEMEAYAQAGPVGEVVAFLRDMLSGRPQSVEELKQAAAEAGVAWRTIERQKKRAGVGSRKRGMGGGWEWFLIHEPESRFPKTAEDTHPLDLVPFGGLRESLPSEEIAEAVHREDF